MAITGSQPCRSLTLALRLGIITAAVHSGAECSPASLSDDSEQPEWITLKWIPATESPPKSEYIANPVQVRFQNPTDQPVRLFWIRPRDGEKKQLGTLPGGEARTMKTHERAVWEFRAPAGHTIGYVQAGPKDGKVAVKPPASPPAKMEQKEPAGSASNPNHDTAERQN